MVAQNPNPNGIRTWRFNNVDKSDSRSNQVDAGYNPSNSAKYSVISPYISPRDNQNGYNGYSRICSTHHRSSSAK